MRERITDLLARLPPNIASLTLAGVTLASVFSCGVAVRGTLAEQIDLPREVAAFEVRVNGALDSLTARVDNTRAQIRNLVRSQERLTHTVGRLICVLEREQEGASTVGCGAAPD